MSKWQELDIEDKIIRILKEIPDAAPEHHLGRPFLTAYQIAIEFARRHPEETDQLGFPIGGAGTGQRNSLAQYLAGQLSRNIAAGRLSEVEGGFLSNQHRCWRADHSLITDRHQLHAVNVPFARLKGRRMALGHV
jgi:hypothetical protein